MITSIIFTAGIASALSLSFSPTIYASGNRIFFVTDILLLIVIHIMESVVILTRRKTLK